MFQIKDFLHLSFFTLHSTLCSLLLADHVFKAGTAGCDIAEAFFLRLFVVFKVALEEDHFAFVFKGEDVCGEAVDKPAVVGDHQDTAREIFKTFL